MRTSFICGLTFPNSRVNGEGQHSEHGDDASANVHVYEYVAHLRIFLRIVHVDDADHDNAHVCAVNIHAHVHEFLALIV